MPTTLTTYGPGGYDPSDPNGNIVAVTDVPDTPTEPTADDRIADARAALTGIDQLGARPTVADLVVVLAALRDALA